jgi:HEAT repeat protein
VDVEAQTVRALDADPHAAATAEKLRRALGHSHWMVVTAAAELIARHELGGFERELEAVWQRFAQNGAKVDPGCRAKDAALTALDRLEIMDPEPFLVAARYRQLEPVMGGSVDTAGAVRQRALYGLYRTLHPHAALYAGELLADASADVRAGVIHAIEHYGDPASAALLAHKLRAGDEDPNVAAACGAALLAVAFDFALAIFVEWLRSPDAARRETAALALGQSRRPDAITALLDWVGDAAWDRDIELGLRALGLSRDERARAYLLDLVEHAAVPRARKAIEALAVHRYDADLTARVRRAASLNSGAGLGTTVERAFRDPG